MQSVNGVMIEGGSLIDTHAASNSRRVGKMLSGESGSQGGAVYFPELARPILSITFGAIVGDAEHLAVLR